MPKTKKGTVKDKKQSTSKKTGLKGHKKPVFKFDINQILIERLMEQTAKFGEEKVNDELFEEPLKEIIDSERDDKLPVESINFNPVDLSNYNIPFEDSSDSDLTKLCVQRLQILLIELNEVEAIIHFNHLLSANWSPEFYIVQNILCKWRFDLDTQTSDPSLEYQIKDYKNISRHNFELVINFISQSIVKNNKKFSVDELLTIAKYTVKIFLQLCGQMTIVLKRLFDVCIETALEIDNGPAILAFAQELYSEHNEDNLLQMTVPLFLPLQGQISKKIYTYLTYNLYKSLLGKTDTENTFPSSIKDWFVQDLVNMDYFKNRPGKVLSSVIQLLEHVVFIFDLYEEEEKLQNMYDFLYAAVKKIGLSNSMILINSLDQWRLRLFRLHTMRIASRLQNWDIMNE